VALDEHNRWVELSHYIPWDVTGRRLLAEFFCWPGPPGEETARQIQENPYFQYLVGLPGYQRQALFVRWLSLGTRKRPVIPDSVFSDSARPAGSRDFNNLLDPARCGVPIRSIGMCRHVVKGTALSQGIDKKWSALQTKEKNTYWLGVINRVWYSEMCIKS